MIFSLFAEKTAEMQKQQQKSVILPSSNPQLTQQKRPTLQTWKPEVSAGAGNLSCYNLNFKPHDALPQPALQF